MYNFNFQDIDKDEFLRKYWQKAPCLFKSAFPSPANYLTADELAGFALDEDVESRLIQFNPKKQQWLIEHGPLSQNIFQYLPESNWTLLVQSIDSWLPATQNLLEHFSFIPRWRFDDIMVSYATDQGGVGPHCDNYDVFLIQGEGKRHWRVGAKGQIGKQTQIIDGLSHLDNFDPIIDVIMQPGDMLYVPPETAHWGVSVGESIGYSIGYRSIQSNQLLALLTEHLSENVEAKDFFADEYRSNSNHKNRIDPQVTRWAQQELIKLSNQPELITELISRQLSHSKLGLFSESEQLNIQELNENSLIQLNKELGVNWWTNQDKVMLNIEGESFVFEKYLITAIEKLANFERCSLHLFKKPPKAVDFPVDLTNLVNRGYVNLVN